ncbi:MAG: ATP-binding protein, partial [Caulobacterales bacterium]|nr:ATP-binding protein [Caulobacterales bacterium]
PMGRTCGKAPKCMAQYQSRISGPMLDRIDIQIDLPAVSISDLSMPPPVEGTKEIAARVLKARQLQAQRYEGENLSAPLNVVISGDLLEKYASPDASGKDLLMRAADKMRLSARAYHRTLKVARTIADLDGQENIKRIHIAEALAYRRNDPIEAQGQNISNPNFSNKFI